MEIKIKKSIKFKNFLKIKGRKNKRFLMLKLWSFPMPRFKYIKNPWNK